MKFIFRSTQIVIVLIIIFGTIGFLSVSQISQLNLIKTAQANHCNVAVEITAGSSGPISASADPDFGGVCLPGTIQDAIGVTFNSVYSDSGYCSNGNSYTRYITTQYDATALSSITEPVTYVFGVDSVQDSGGECTSAYGTIEITIIPSTPYFTCSVSPTTHTVDPGSDYAYNITSNAVNGFNSPVTYTASVSPDTAVKPVVSLPGSGQVPPGPTVATVTTTSSTTDDTYTITFTGTGGGETAVCSTEFIVNPPGPDFALTISPSTASINKGDSQVYDVFASCTGGLAGLIDNMSATSSLMTGPILTLGSTSIPCGGSTTLTVSNTNLTNVQQLSDPAAINAILNSITVIGRAQTN